MSRSRSERLRFLIIVMNAFVRLSSATVRGGGRRLVVCFALGLAAGLDPTPARAADRFTDPPAPTLAITSLSPGLQRISFDAFPAADQFHLWAKSDLAAPWSPDGSGVFSNLTWTGSLSAGPAFRRLEVTPLSSNAVLTATVLSRLTYGPTPDLLDRLTSVGPEAYIAEQLAPEVFGSAGA